MRWIKSNEMLPENEEIKYFIFCADGIVRTASFVNGNWQVNGKYYDYIYVTDWKPILPPSED